MHIAKRIRARVKLARMRWDHKVIALSAPPDGLQLTGTPYGHSEPRTQSVVAIGLQNRGTGIAMVADLDNGSVIAPADVVIDGNYTLHLPEDNS